MFQAENPKSVFEIGCANGGLLKDLTSEYKDLVVGGMDISESIRKCADLFPNQKENFILRSITDPWPVETNSYDIVFSVGVLMYIFNPIPVLREMIRVAKDKIILAEYHHPQVDFCGQMTRGYLDLDKGEIQIGIIRDYLTLFNLLKIPMSIDIDNNFEDKTIIKCNLNK